MMTTKQKIDFVLKTQACALVVAGLLFGLTYLMYKGMNAQFFPTMMLVFLTPLAAALFLPSSGITYKRHDLYRWVITIFELGVASYVMAIDTILIGYASADGNTALLFFFSVIGACMIRIIFMLYSQELHYLESE